jgi:benzylsuccinate CoA-transferase BbsE subunit
MMRLLEQISVVEIGKWVMCRYAGQLLAQAGASVSRVSSGPDRLNTLVLGDRAQAAFVGLLDRGKRTVSLELGTEMGKARLREMLAQADVLLCDLSAAELEQEELSPARLASDFPRLVFVSGTSDGLYGTEGLPAATDMVSQHRGAIAYNRMRPVADPKVSGPASGPEDEILLAGAVALASCAVSGVLARDSRPTAPQLELALVDYCGYIGIEEITEWNQGERDFRRDRSGRTGVEIAGGSIWALQCSDGWVLSSPREDHQWSRWLEVMGSPEWANDEALCGSRAARKANWVAIHELMTQWSLKQSKNDIFEAAQHRRVACFPLSTTDDLFHNEQLRHRGYIQVFERDSEAILVPGLPFFVHKDGVRN